MLAFIFTIVINIPSHPLCFVHPLKCHLKERTVQASGCTKLKSLQLTGCPQISSLALAELLLQLRSCKIVLNIFICKQALLCSARARVVMVFALYTHPQQLLIQVIPICDVNIDIDCSKPDKERGRSIK